MHAAFGLQTARCHACIRPEVRKSWGCDAPVNRSVFVSTCPACLGVRWTEEGPREPRPKWPFAPTQGVIRDWAKPGPWPCTGCDGHGEVNWFRCPQASSDVAARELVQLWFAERDGLPMLEGGKARQTRYTKLAFGLIGMEVARIEEERMKRARTS